MKKAFFFFFLLFAITIQAQRMMQYQKIADDRVVWLSSDTLNRKQFTLSVGTGWDKDPLFVKISIDSLCRALYGLKKDEHGKLASTDSVSWDFAGPTNANLFFVNKNLGFVYGNFEFHRCYVWLSMAYVIRTIDGGKTWELAVGDSNQKKAFLNNHDEIKADAFFMFDEYKGILLTNRHTWDGKISYQITADGGKTWKEQFVDQKEKTVLVSSIHFTASGTCTIVLATHGKAPEKPNDERKTLVMQSVDYGRNFRLLK